MPSMTKFLFDDWQAAARERIDTALIGHIDTQAPAPRLTEAMRYSLLAGGKRLRPLLCVAACELHGGTQEQALIAACAIEILHTYSLIHDDLPAMDDDDLRRGLPSCHKAFDEATAILAGDALQALAFELLTTQGNYSDSQRLAMLRQLTQAAGATGMVAGQMQDMAAAGKRLDLTALETLHRLKTGRLIEASLLLGALAAGRADKATLERMQQLGQLLGLAFQVQDDILDVIGSTEQLGKTSGADAALGKNTFPALLGLASSRDYAQRLCQQALDLLHDIDDKAAPLRAITHFIIERQR